MWLGKEVLSELKVLEISCKAFEKKCGLTCQNKHIKKKKKKRRYS